MIVVHATFPIEPDRRDEALELIDPLLERTREEEGTIEYRAATDLEDPNVIRFFERYEDEAALEAHTETDAFQAFQAALPDLLDGEPEIVQFDVEGATELGA